MLDAKCQFNDPPEPSWLKIHRRFTPHRCLITLHMQVFVSLSTVQSTSHHKNPRNIRFSRRPIASNTPPMPHLSSINVPKVPKS